MIPNEEFTIFDLFLRFNRRLVRVLGSMRLSLSVNESHVLAEIAREGEVLAKDISETLRIEKSTLSRTIDSLRKRGLVVYARKSADRRAKELNPSPRGAAALAADVEQRNRSIGICLGPLLPAQRAVIAGAFRHINNSLAVRSVADLAEEDPVEHEIRRLTRGLGALSGNAMNTGLSMERCQTLWLLFASGGRLPFAALKQELPYEISALSRLISALTSRGLIAKERDPKDKRTIFAVLTRAGGEEALRMARQGEEHLRTHLRDLLPERLAEFIGTLEILYQSGPPRMPRERLRVVRLQSAGDLQKARKFVIEQLVLRDSHHELPGSLLPGDALVMAVKHEQRFLAVGAVEKGAHLSHFITAAEGEFAAASRLLLSTLWKEARGKTPHASLKAGPQAAPALKKLFPGRTKSGASLNITPEMMAQLEGEEDS